MEITRVGLDLAKNVFEVHGVNGNDRPVLRKRLTRAKVAKFFANLPACLVALEACASAHHWARVLRSFGHQVRLIDPRFVIPYRKGGKNDGNDAEAICEAAGRPSMRFVPVKSAEQQAVLTVHRARSLLVAQRTALTNQLRGLLGEFGLVAAQGRGALRRALPEILEDAENALPDLAREIFAEIAERLDALDRQVACYDQRIEQLAKASPQAELLMQIPGVGPLTATAVVATVGDAHDFNNGRQLAAWLGLTPRQHSSAGTTRLGRITKRGDEYLRTLLVHGARSTVRTADRRTDPTSRWVRELRDRRGLNKAIVAMAAKNARIIWAMLASGEPFQRPGTVPAGA